MRADPERRKEYLKKEKERYDRSRKFGLKPSIDDLSDMEKIQQREKWRKAKRKSRTMKKIRAHSADDE